MYITVEHHLSMSLVVFRLEHYFASTTLDFQYLFSFYKKFLYHIQEQKFSIGFSENSPLSI